MYKIIHNGKVIDVVKELRYVRYLSQFKKMIPTTSVSAEAICGSDNRTFYALQGVKIPAEKKHWKVVSFIEIPETEYTELLTQLNKNVTVYASKKELNSVREIKISKLSKQCNEMITAGINVLLNDGFYHNFRLTIEDQINLADIQREIDAGATQICYHATNDVCKLYTVEEMLQIIQCANKHKRHHTTYFNLLKHCINNMNNINEIEDIEYGVNLYSLDVSEDIKSQIRGKL